jgi:tetratricopeptide (TPR) repeat protein
MNGKTSKSNTASPKTIAITPTTSSNTMYRRQRITQNFLLIWMDASIDQSNKDCQNTLAQLQTVVEDVYIFTQCDECIDFLTEVNNMKVFLIIAGALGRQILPLIHNIPQLDVVYIFDHNKSNPEQWAKTWIKVKGIHTDITSICGSLQQTVKQLNQDAIAMSFVTLEEAASSQYLDQLDPSFMYAQLFKEILLEMEYTEQSIKYFTSYCLRDGYGSPINITRFENDYKANLAIWWYTYPSFIYSMLNDALRILSPDTIINMGFFIRDLHHQIEQLHQKQVSSYQGKSFVVYRGQGLSINAFDKLRKTKDGLMSFNNFLSTSKAQDISLGFAIGALSKTGMVGILFQMTIDPSVSSAPFAFIDDVSYFQTEEEILFSIHTVFRIGDIKQIDKNNPLYQVDLTLTSDDDPQLRILTERIREETSDSTGWKRLGRLLLKLSQFDKAEELYTALLGQAFHEDEKALYYNNLGYVKDDQGDYEKSIWYYEKGLEICQKALPPSHPSLATSYNNIGGVYIHMGEYSKALTFLEKALEIDQIIIPPNHPDLATSYNNIGAVYIHMGEYSKALSFLEKAFKIKQKTLPQNHPDLATSYNIIGMVYNNMGEYSKALSFLEKALEIKQKTLPPNHPDLATSYNNIGMLCNSMGEYSKTLPLYEKALEINQKTLPPNHPSLATSYNDIGGVYADMGEYWKALSFYEKALEIYQKTLPPNYPDLATSYNDIGGVYADMGEYWKALSFLEKVLEIKQKTLPPNHPSLATSYNDIGVVYADMEEYSEALSFYEKSVEIDQNIVPPNHPDLATFYSNIGEMYIHMGEYSKALSFYEKSVEIDQKTLPPNHPDLTTSYNNIGAVYYNMGEHSKALSFYEKALEIDQKTLPPNHPDLATSYNNIGGVYIYMGEYSKALSYFERALDIWHSSLHPTHPQLQKTRESIEIVKRNIW